MQQRTRPGAVYLFSGPDGPPIRTIKAAWKGLMLRADIKGFRIHDLRHTFASWLVNRGASLTAIGSLLGHTQAATTMRYAHTNDRGQRDALALLASPPKPVALLEAAIEQGQ
jgi:integrase